MYFCFDIDEQVLLSTLPAAQRSLSVRVEKTCKHRKLCLGNILVGWGTFWTKTYVILVHIPIFTNHTLFKTNNNYQSGS